VDISDNAVEIIYSSQVKDIMPRSTVEKVIQALGHTVLPSSVDQLLIMSHVLNLTVHYLVAKI
jgi:hypothetical protein